MVEEIRDEDSEGVFDNIRDELLEKRLREFTKQGHFRLTKGLDSDIYFLKDDINQNPGLVMHLGWQVFRLRGKLDWIQKAGVVIAIGAAIPFAFATAVYNGTYFVYAEKKSGSLVLRKTFQQDLKGRNVLIIEDAVSTGGTADELVELVKMFGGNPVGVVALCKRGEFSFEIPFLAFLDLGNPNYIPGSACPGCRENLPYDPDLGHAPSKPQD